MVIKLVLQQNLMNRTSVFSAFRWFYYIEILIIPYSLFMLVVAATEGTFLEISFLDWLGYYVLLGGVCFTFIVAAVLKLGSIKDYRVQVSIRCLVIIHLAASAGAIAHANGAFNIFSKSNDFQILSLAPIVLHVFLGICVLFTIFGLSDKFLGELRNISEKIEKKDLTRRLSSKEILTDSAFGPIAKTVNNMIVLLVETVDTLRNTSQHVASSSQGLASTSEEVNALSEEIAATVQQISRGASDQSSLSSKALTDLKKMSDVIDASIQNIEGTLRVIEDVASQTNILALNAAIEAARAGEYGRGFAVVADNVRRLAEETKNNAADINKLTEEIVTNIGGTTHLLQETLQGFAAQSEEFSASSEEVAAATEEQTAAMNQMTSASQELTELSDKLLSLINIFQL